MRFGRRFKINPHRFRGLGGIARFAALQGVGLLPGGSLVRTAAESLGYAGDSVKHSVKGQKRVARKVHKVAVKHGAVKHAPHRAGKHGGLDIGGLISGGASLIGALKGGGVPGGFGAGGMVDDGGLSAAVFGGGHGFGRRRRSINPANAKALRRSMRRLESFSKLAHRVMSFKTHHKLKSHRKGRR